MGAFEDLIRERFTESYNKRALCPDDGFHWIMMNDRLWCPFCGRYREDDDAS